MTMYQQWVLQHYYLSILTSTPSTSVFYTFTHLAVEVISCCPTPKKINNPGDPLVGTVLTRLTLKAIHRTKTNFHHASVILDCSSTAVTLLKTHQYKGRIILTEVPT